MPPRSTSTTREKLVEVAAELFHSQGYAATGLKQILCEADVNSGSLYHFFRNKEDLLLGVLERYKELLWPVLLQPIWDRTDDPLERIFGLLDAYRQGLVATGFTASCPIGNLSLELGEFHPHAHDLLAQNFEGWRLAVRGCLEDLGDGLTAECDLDKLATFILTTMEGAVMQSRSYRSIDPFDSSIEMLRDYLDRLMRSREERRTAHEPLIHHTRGSRSRET